MFREEITHLMIRTISYLNIGLQTRLILRLIITNLQMRTPLQTQMSSRFSTLSIVILQKRKISDLGQALMAPIPRRTAITNMQVLPLMSTNIFRMIMNYQTQMVNAIKIQKTVMSPLSLRVQTMKIFKNKNLKRDILVKANHSNRLPPP